MEFTLKDIVNTLPFKFSKGDSEVLKNLMLKDDNKFLKFRGKDQFDKKVKTLYPEINFMDLSNDYSFIRGKSNSTQRLYKWYKQLGDKLYLKFEYDLSWNNDGMLIGTEFEILNGVILKATDCFWNKYLPPNFANDYSSVSYLFDPINKITPIPENLPESNFEFDLNGLFLSQITPIEKWQKGL